MNTIIRLKRKKRLRLRSKGMKIRAVEEQAEAGAERELATAMMNLMAVKAAKRGETLLHPEQKQIAYNIAIQLLMMSTLIITLCASMQWGKTGVILQVAYLIVTHIDKSIPPENVIILTGMSDNEWRGQTKIRVLSSFRVFHRGNLKKIARELKTIRNALIVIDECQFGTGQKCIISKTLREAGLLNIVSLQERNIRILQTSATPDAVLVESEDWNREGREQYHLKVVPKNPASYTSLKDIKEDGRLFQSMDLTDEGAASDLVKKMKTFKDPKFHIIRLPSRQKKQQKIIENLTRLAEKNDIEMKEHNSYNRIDDPEILLSQEPPKHTIILIKGMWCAAKTFPDTYLGVLHEVYAKKRSSSSEVQGLPGRACGHSKKSGSDAVIIYCDLSSINNYIQLMENNYNYNFAGFEWNSRRIKKIKDVRPHVKPSYADSQQVLGISGALQNQEPIVEKSYDYYAHDVGFNSYGEALGYLKTQEANIGSTINIDKMMARKPFHRVGGDEGDGYFMTTKAHKKDDILSNNNNIAMQRITLQKLQSLGIGTNLSAPSAPTASYVVYPVYTNMDAGPNDVKYYVRHTKKK